MLRLLGEVLPLALGAAVSPVILGVVVLILSERTRPRARAVAFTLGASLPLVALGVAGLVFVSRISFPGIPKIPDGVRPIVDLAFGGILVLLALRRAFRHPTGKKRHHSIGDDWGLPRFAALGMGAMATNVTSLALIIPAIKDIADSPVGLGGQFLALAILIVFALAPALVPLLLYSISPQRAAAGLERFEDAVRRRSRPVLTVVFAGLGVYLIVRGVLEL